MRSFCKMKKKLVKKDKKKCLLNQLLKKDRLNMILLSDLKKLNQK